MSTLTLPYNMIVKTRYVYAGRAHHQTAQLGRILVFIHFEDEDGMTFTVSADNGRFQQQIPYIQERQSGRSADGMSDYRHFVYVDIKEGFWGSFFDVQTTKVVPATGEVEYEGILFDVDLIEVPEEFSTGY